MSYLFLALLNWIYSYVAFYLNTWENHRTETENKNGLIVKTFVFQFVNSYLSLFYVAFIKVTGTDVWGGPRDDKCEPGECIQELTSALASLMITSQVLAQITETLMPTFWNKFVNYWEETKMKLMGMTPRPMSLVERESKFFAYTSTFEGILLSFFTDFVSFFCRFNDHHDVDYNEMVIQFGYVTLFAAGFPPASVFAFINNAFEIRADALKVRIFYTVLLLFSCSR